MISVDVFATTFFIRKSTLRIAHSCWVPCLSAGMSRPLSARGQRLPFTVFKVSSEDPGHICTELNQQTPDTRGWQSQKDSGFPQEIQLQFDSRVHLAQLQLLSHEFKIATRVELYIWDPDTATQQWQRLGHFSLNHNQASDHKARELKSVQLSGGCTRMMLRLLDCHRNNLNRNNQVGIIALSIFGEFPVRAPPVGAPLVGGLDMLAQDLNVDRETARKIRDLTAQKEAAVAAEDYDTAKQCKVQINALQKVVTQIGELERRKRAAVQEEDYDTAKQLKIEIERLKVAPTVPDPPINVPQHVAAVIPAAVPVNEPPYVESTQIVPHRDDIANVAQQLMNEPPASSGDEAREVADPAHPARDPSRMSVYTDTKWDGPPNGTAEPAYETYEEAAELPPSPSRMTKPSQPIEPFVEKVPAPAPVLAPAPAPELHYEKAPSPEPPTFGVDNQVSTLQYVAKCLVLHAHFR